MLYVACACFGGWVSFFAFLSICLLFCVNDDDRKLRCLANMLDPRCRMDRTCVYTCAGMTKEAAMEAYAQLLTDADAAWRDHEVLKRDDAPK